jgi:hypothetical protein
LDKYSLDYSKDKKKSLDISDKSMDLTKSMEIFLDSIKILGYSMDLNIIGCVS